MPVTLRSGLTLLLTGDARSDHSEERRRPTGRHQSAEQRAALASRYSTR